MKARLLASILAETIRLLLKRHDCGCLECKRARANLLMVETELRPRLRKLGLQPDGTYRVRRLAGL